MSYFQELTRAIGDINSAFVEFRENHQQQLEELRGRLEELEMRNRAPSATSPSASGIDRDHVKAFERWLRTKDASAEQELRNIETELMRKGVVISDLEAGGHAVPQVILREIERLELQISPIRGLVRVVQAATGDFKAIVNERGTTAGWVGESDVRVETDTSKLRDRKPTSGELYALPKASAWAINDVFFNVASWLAEETAQMFAVQEEDAVLYGDGSNKPTGMLNTSPVATPDFASPARDADAFEAIEVRSTQSPAVAEITPDSLVDIVYQLNRQYRSGASWIMNSETAAEVMKLKDAQGRFLWVPSIAAGQPDTLLGYPVNIVEGMPPIGANNYPIGFGNWSRAYLMIDIGPTMVTRDEVTQPGFVKFYVRRRVGGIVYNNHAAKFLKVVTT